MPEDTPRYTYAMILISGFATLSFAGCMCMKTVLKMENEGMLKETLKITKRLRICIQSEILNMGGEDKKM